MDRRTLLAFALATVVLVAWGFLFPGPQPVREGPDSTGVALPAAGGERRGAPIPGPGGPAGEGSGPGGAPAATAAVDSLTAPEAAMGGQSPTAAGEESAWEVAPLDTVRVETDLFDAKILTRGGGLGGLSLKAFPNGLEPGQVNLVRAGHDALDLTLHWDDRDESLGGAQYSVRQEQRVEGDSRVQEVVLEARRSDGLTVTRRYIFSDRTYVVKHLVQVAGIAADSPPDLVIGWRAGIPYTEGSRQANEQFFASILRVGDELANWGPGKFKQGPRRLEGAVRWVAVCNKYFLAALVPAAGTAIAAGADGDPTSFRNTVWLEIPASGASGGTVELTLYLGPRDLHQLNALGVGLGDAVSLGYRWMRPLTGFMLRVLKGTHSIVPNYGWVIIVLSVLVRVLLLPLNQASMKSMKAMQELAPHIEKLRKDYREKPQELQKRIMQLYQKNKVNPMGGCLPMVLQMPVLFALYFVLMFAIELRMAPFILWIDDLSAPDTVARVSGFSVHVLPLIMTGVSVLQAKSSPKAKDPQQAMLTTIMPVMFLVLFYSMPSGLVLYWTVTSLGTWAQQAWINRGTPQLSAAGGEVEASEVEEAGTMVDSAVAGGDGSGARIEKSRAAGGSPSRRRRR